MTSPIADGVLAATHRLVQQAMSGQWQDVPKTVQERRVLLDKLSANASPQDQQWLSALKQAMAESDAVVASLTPAQGLEARAALAHPCAPPHSHDPCAADSGLGSEAPAQSPTDEVDAMLDMIRGSK